MLRLNLRISRIHFPLAVSKCAYHRLESFEAVKVGTSNE